ncbi:MAG: LLM class flavin-dependent oxidoreductase, partial [Actinobacteria bacterium]|nr:LLM class flavin-dependent oxidoreductase [Actinomycetota bacterium]
LEHLAHLRELEITHFTMDFGHPLTPEHVLRFAEQVIDVMRAS